MSAVHSEIRLPAYGRQLLDLRKRGLVPDRDLVISTDSWKWGIGCPRVVFPQDLDADAADLRFVAGIPCFLAWGSSKTTIERRDAIIRQIVRCKPSRLWCCDMEMPSESFFVITKAKGLEREEFKC
jgi:hypothetical protein